MYGLNPISPNEERSKTLILFFRIFMIILAANVVVELITAAAFSGTDVMGMDTQTLIMGGLIVAVFRAVNFILLAVFFIMWQRRAYHNLHKAGARNLRHSEGWAAGAWWIPFLNLSWPLQIMRDIWNETQTVFRRQGEQYEMQQDNITGSWWALFLIAGFVTQAGSYILRNRGFELGYVFAAVGTLGYIFAAFLAVSMIKRISAMEAEMMDRAQQYYAWLTHEQAKQYQQTQENMQHPVQQQENAQEQFHNPETTRPPDSNEDQSSQDNFYKP